MPKTEDIKLDGTERDELAFRLYAERIAKMPAQVNGEESSRWAFRKAEDFLTIRERIRAGTESTKAPEGPQLAEVSAPNLKPTHPHNLVSNRFGNLAKVREVKDWLDKHPRSDESPVAYAPLDWDAPTTNLARVLLPNYVSN